MFEILTVCTGNICRSPLAEVLLRTRLAEFAPRVHSVGTHGLDGWGMTPESQRLAVDSGVAVTLAQSHRSRRLAHADLVSPDLVLAMSREHRDRIVELAPARVQSTFTVREFARLALGVTDAEVGAAADASGGTPSARVRAAVQRVAEQRDTAAPPADPADDDVMDPYGGSQRVYELSAAQLIPAIDQVCRIVRLAMATG